ncbi:TPA: plasmid IncI1-type surface exclusion protein ExcA [Klebsiella oxytoca]
MESQRERTRTETIVLVLKVWAAIIYFPVCLFFAFLFTISSRKGSFELEVLFWVLFVTPFIIRQFTLQKRRRALNSVVKAVSGGEFMPQKGNVIISGNRTYLGVDAIRGTLLYVSMRRKGEYDVMGLDMSSWTRVAYKGDVITLKTKNPEFPSVSVDAPGGEKYSAALYDVICAMEHRQYTDLQFPQKVHERARTARKETGLAMFSYT